MRKTLFLEQEISRLNYFITEENRLDKEVSTSSTHWHVAHTLLVINRVIYGLKASEPSEYKSNFNLKRFILFTLNRIPRGKGRAPKQVLPKENITKQDLMDAIQEAKSNLSVLKTLDKHAHFYHPLFNYLNKKQTQKFLKLHTQHHLKILEDISQK